MKLEVPVEDQLNSLSLDLSFSDDEEDDRKFIGHFVSWYNIRDNKVVNPRPALKTFVKEYLDRDRSYLRLHKEGDSLFQGTYLQQSNLEYRASLSYFFFRLVQSSLL